MSRVEKSSDPDQVRRPSEPDGLLKTNGAIDVITSQLAADTIGLEVEADFDSAVASGEEFMDLDLTCWDPCSKACFIKEGSATHAELRAEAAVVIQRSY